jgi:hypothetical protein
MYIIIEIIVCENCRRELPMTSLAPELAAVGSLSHQPLPVSPASPRPASCSNTPPHMEALNPNAELLESRACTVLFTIIRESSTTQRDVSCPCALSCLAA